MKNNKKQLKASALAQQSKGIQKLDGKAMKGIRGGLTIGVEDVIPT